MPFISEEIENRIIRGFAESLGIPPNEVEFNINENPQRPSITLHGKRMLKDETVEARFTITQTGRNEYTIQGNIDYIGKAPRTRSINQPIKGSPESLGQILTRIMSSAKIKKKGFFQFF